jgi:3-oxoacyl-[acyl-carrier protein] reductase
MIDRQTPITKVALITGVSRRIGIGAAAARALATAGVTVFTTYYRPYDAAMRWGSQVEEAENVLAELRDLGVQAAGTEADLADPKPRPNSSNRSIRHSAGWTS